MLLVQLSLQCIIILTKGRGIQYFTVNLRKTWSFVDLQAVIIFQAIQYLQFCRSGLEKDLDKAGGMVIFTATHMFLMYGGGHVMMKQMFPI